MKDESKILNESYMQNPEVVLREEDEEGGLLYNPDTNQVKVLNPTGLFIWKKFAKGDNLTGIITHIMDEFENVPDDRIQNDIAEFVDELLKSGFLGVIEEVE